MPTQATIHATRLEAHFIGNRLRLNCYKVMLFDLKNAKVAYQMMVNKMFTKKIGRNMEAYRRHARQVD